MNDTNQPQEVEKKELKFSLYFLAKKPNYKSEEIVELSAGPYPSEKEAISQGRKKYGWGISDYAVVKTEQSFQVAKISISN